MSAAAVPDGPSIMGEIYAQLVTQVRAFVGLTALCLAASKTPADCAPRRRARACSDAVRAPSAR